MSWLPSATIQGTWAATGSIWVNHESHSRVSKASVMRPSPSESA